MNRTQIYLPKRHIDKLRNEAKRRQISVSGVIRSILDEKLDKRPVSAEQNFFGGLLGLAERMNRIGKKAPRDLASNVDKYLYGGK